jgi:hypothetical protein
MQIPVLVEPTTKNSFRARAGEPLAVSAEGVTREEALGNLREAMKQQLRPGAQLVAVEVPAEGNPWLAMAGIIDPDDPLVQEWKREMDIYRQEVEDDPDSP